MRGYSGIPRVPERPVAASYTGYFDGAKGMVTLHGLTVIMTRLPEREIKDFERCLRGSLNRPGVRMFLDEMPDYLKVLESGGYVPPLVSHAVTMSGVTDDIVDKVLIPLIKNTYCGFRPVRNEPKPPPQYPPGAGPRVYDGPPIAYVQNRHRISPDPPRPDSPVLRWYNPSPEELQRWAEEAGVRDAEDRRKEEERERLRRLGILSSVEEARRAFAWEQEVHDQEPGEGAWMKQQRDMMNERRRSGKTSPTHRFILKEVEAQLIAAVYERYT